MMLEETGKPNQLFDLAKTFQTTRRGRGRNRRNMRKPDLLNFVGSLLGPLEATLRFLGRVCSNH